MQIFFLYIKKPDGIFIDKMPSGYNNLDYISSSVALSQNLLSLIGLVHIPCLPQI